LGFGRRQFKGGRRTGIEGLFGFSQESMRMLLPILASMVQRVVRTWPKKPFSFLDLGLYCASSFSTTCTVDYENFGVCLGTYYRSSEYCWLFFLALLNEELKYISIFIFDLFRCIKRRIYYAFHGWDNIKR
jgi:hypothetical protein